MIQTKLYDQDSAINSGPVLHAVLVNGESKRVSTEDLIKAYEKVGGADERFRSAAQMVEDTKKKQGELEALQEELDEYKDSHNLLQSLESQDQQKQATAFVKLSQRMGASFDTATQMWDALHGTVTQANSTGTQSNGTSANKDSNVDISKLPLSAYPKDVQEAVAFVRELRESGIDRNSLAVAINSTNRGANQEAKGDIEKGLDRIPYFARLFKVKGSEAKRALVTQVYEDLERRVGSGKGHYEKHLQDSLAKAQSQADLFVVETPSDPSSPLGLGSGPAGPRTPLLQANQLPTLPVSKVGDLKTLTNFLVERVNTEKALADQQEAFRE